MYYSLIYLLLILVAYKYSIYNTAYSNYKQYKVLQERVIKTKKFLKKRYSDLHVDVYGPLIAELETLKVKELKKIPFLIRKFYT